MFFINDEHKKRFLEVLKKDEETDEKKAYLYIMTAEIEDNPLEEFAKSLITEEKCYLQGLLMDLENVRIMIIALKIASGVVTFSVDEEEIYTYTTI